MIKCVKKKLTEDYTPEQSKGLEKIFRVFLESEKYLWSEKVDGNHYLTTVDVDFELSREDIIDILDVTNPREYLDRTLEQLNFWDNLNNEYEYGLNEFIDWLSEHHIETFEKDVVIEWFWDNVYDIWSIDYNYDQILRQKIKAMLVINNGDSNYDFTLNPNQDNEYVLEAYSGIAWLATTQGINLEELQEALIAGPKVKTGNKTLDSIVEECYNTSSSMNALTFIGETTLGDAIKYNEGKANITITTRAFCGLYDSWNGGGSDFAIDLSNGIEVPRDKIWYFGIDGGAGGYSTENTYGFNRRAYRPDAFIIRGASVGESLVMNENEEAADGKEKDVFVYFVPYVGRTVCDKAKAIKALKEELAHLENENGPALAGRGFALYCEQAVDKEGEAWVGRDTCDQFVSRLKEYSERYE